MGPASTVDCFSFASSPASRCLRVLNVRRSKNQIVANYHRSAVVNKRLWPRRRPTARPGNAPLCDRGDSGGRDIVPLEVVDIGVGVHHLGARHAAGHAGHTGHTGYHTGHDDAGNGDTRGTGTRNADGTAVLLRAVAGDMAGLAALVARLASGVERPAVRRGAVTRDVAQLAASVALHGLGLAVAREMVRAAALVARRGARASWREAAAAEAGGAGTVRTTTGHGAATAHRTDAGDRGRWARARQVARLPAVVAPAIAAGSRQPQRRAVGLYMAQALAVVALLGLSSARQRALVGLVAYVQQGEESAIRHEPSKSITIDGGWDHRDWHGTGCPYLAACSCSKDARRTSRPRRNGPRCRTCSRHGATETTCRRSW
ncbi:hypothetical protein GGR56DRAFT_597275 [Xylariaceae sp. FL0804]|nr:hypothetical protein GGR56DRAFT_597275 [Xylariaceae sp. FL0804]